MEKHGFSNILENSIENLLLAEKQLKDKKETPGLQYSSLDELWKQIDAISTKLSFDCTKLCIAVCNPPLPSSSEISSLLQSIEQTIFALVSVTAKFDPSNGKALQEKLIFSSVSAIQSARQLLRVIKDDGGAEVNERYRQATGVAWEGCKDLENCPKNNKEAVLRVLENQLSMIADAYTEINESLEENGSFGNFLGSDISDSEPDDEAVWSEEDKVILDPSVNLIKAAKMMCDRLVVAVRKNGSCDDRERITELDELREDCAPISRTIDSLVLDIYPPINIPDMEVQSHSLASHLQTALKTATRSHIITEDEKSTVEFIQKAVDHNLNKMKDLFKKL